MAAEESVTAHVLMFVLQPPPSRTSGQGETVTDDLADTDEDATELP